MGSLFKCKRHLYFFVMMVPLQEPLCMLQSNIENTKIACCALTTIFTEVHLRRRVVSFSWLFISPAYLPDLVSDYHKCDCTFTTINMLN